MNPIIQSVLRDVISMHHPNPPQPIPDLHTPAVDPSGRLDVLAARVVRMAVEKSSDPMLKLWYRQLGPVLDSQLHRHLNGINMRRTLQGLGLIPRTPRRVNRAGRRKQASL